MRTALRNRRPRRRLDPDAGGDPVPADPVFADPVPVDPVPVDPGRPPAGGGPPGSAWTDGWFPADTLRTVGPFVTHLAGRVVAVTDVEPPRRAPSPAPLRVSLLVAAAVFAAPVAVRALPLIAFAASAVLVLWSRPLLRRLRRGQTPASTLRGAAFRVRLSTDSGAAHHDVPCRIVLRDAADTPPLLGGERVVGRGRLNRGRTTLRLRELRVESPNQRYRTPFPLSYTPILLAVVVILGVAVLEYRARRAELAASVGDRLWLTVVAAVLPVILLAAVRLASRRRARSRRGRRKRA